MLWMFLNLLFFSENFWWPVRCSNHWATWTQIAEQWLHLCTVTVHSSCPRLRQNWGNSLSILFFLLGSWYRWRWSTGRRVEKRSRNRLENRTFSRHFHNSGGGPTERLSSPQYGCLFFSWVLSFYTLLYEPPYDNVSQTCDNENSYLVGELGRMQIRTFSFSWQVIFLGANELSSKKTRTITYEIIKNK